MYECTRVVNCTRWGSEVKFELPIAENATNLRSSHLRRKRHRKIRAHWRTAERVARALHIIVTFARKTMGNAHSLVSLKYSYLYYFCFDVKVVIEKWLPIFPFIRRYRFAGIAQFSRAHCFPVQREWWKWNCWRAIAQKYSFFEQIFSAYCSQFQTRRVVHKAVIAVCKPTEYI